MIKTTSYWEHGDVVWYAWIPGYETVKGHGATEDQAIDDLIRIVKQKTGADPVKDTRKKGE
jgi:hypothetical protein